MVTTHFPIEYIQQKIGVFYSCKKTLASFLSFVVKIGNCVVAIRSLAFLCVVTSVATLFIFKGLFINELCGEFQKCTFRS